MIRLENVTKTYKGATDALRNVNVNIDKGEFVFLVGASGSGKSTFIRLLNREETPTEGRIWVAGKDVAQLNSAKVPYLRRNLGYKLLSLALAPRTGISLLTASAPGTLLLEWSRLSDLTHNPIYRKKVLASEAALIKAKTVLPGLPGQVIWPQNGTHRDSVAGRYVTWGGGTDSYLEYLIKYARITNTDDNLFADTWATAVDSSIRTLAVVRPFSRGWEAQMMTVTLTDIYSRKPSFLSRPR